MNMISRLLPNPVSSAVLPALALLLLFAESAHAYVGPGLGAGTLGVILGLIGSVFLALFAFFWYPIKRALFGNKANDDDDEEYDVAEQLSDAPGNTDGQLKNQPDDR